MYRTLNQTIYYVNYTYGYMYARNEYAETLKPSMCNGHRIKRNEILI